MVDGLLGANGLPALYRVGMVTSGDIGHAVIQYLNIKGYPVRERIYRYY
jgi:hypothetical protein